jgi:hypothetical protein
MSSINIYASYSAKIATPDGTWNNLMTATSANIAAGGEMVTKVERENGSVDYFKIARSWVDFNTSSIPDNATITAVTLNINCGTNVNQIAGIYIVGSNKTENQIVAGDWDTVIKTAYSAYIAGSFGTGLKSFSLNATGIAAISKTGYTKLSIIQSNDFSSIASGQGNDYFQFYGYNDSVSARRPYLTITYTTPPVVTTGEVTELKSVTATLGGNVTDAGGGTVSERGVCWALTENPTTSSSKATSVGTTGAYTVSATGLIAGQLYHYRAYITTENSTTYGTDLTFRTINGGNFIPFLL